MRCRAAVIGCSAGGIEAVLTILAQLTSDFRLPIIVVQHLHKEQGEHRIRFYGNYSCLPVQEAEEKEKILPGRIYLAPPDYHLLIEQDETFSLSVDEKVNYSRPSVDVLFESAADAYGSDLVGIILSGANHDGALGMKRIHNMGGLTLVQDPTSAQFAEMPNSVLRLIKADQILAPEELGKVLNTL